MGDSNSQCVHEWWGPLPDADGVYRVRCNNCGVDRDNSPKTQRSDIDAARDRHDRAWLRRIYDRARAADFRCSIHGSELSFLLTLAWRGVPEIDPYAEKEPNSTGGDVLAECERALTAAYTTLSGGDEFLSAEDSLERVRQALNAIAGAPSSTRDPQRPAVAAPEKDRIYPCQRCGKPRTMADGGTTFTVCDSCWETGSQPGAVGTLRAQLDEALIALRAARDELGVPQPGYPAPVANAANIIASALSKIGSES